MAATCTGHSHVGTQPLSIWLREGFEQLGYTPPLPLMSASSSPTTGTSHTPLRSTSGKLWDATKRAVTLFLYPVAQAFG